MRLPNTAKVTELTFPVPGGPKRSIPDVKLRPRIPYEKISGLTKGRLIDVCNVSIVVAGAQILSNVVLMRAATIAKNFQYLNWLQIAYGLNLKLTWIYDFSQKLSLMFRAHLFESF